MVKIIKISISTLKKYINTSRETAEQYIEKEYTEILEHQNPDKNIQLDELKKIIVLKETPRILNTSDHILNATLPYIHQQSFEHGEKFKINKILFSSVFLMYA